MDHALPVESPAEKTYAISGKIMLSAIVVLFAVVVFMVGLHLYARWYVLRLRRRSRRRTGAVIYVDNHVNPRSVADRGLELSVLNSLPLFVYATKAEGEPPLPAECAVCLSEFGPSEVVRLLPKCRHTFHVDCIGMWFHSHSTCPLCRSAVEATVSVGETPETATAAEQGNASESSSSSSSETGTELCATCQHEGEGSNTTSLWGRRKSIVGGGILGIRIETPAAAASELSQSSPGGRLLSLKRIFSMTRKTPTGSSGSGTTPHGTAAGTSGASELDLEAGVSETARVGTPR